MTRRAIVWFAVIFAALVVLASPASAASVASINTTDQDFQDATLDDMEISGTGESASVTGDVGYSDSVDTGTASQDFDWNSEVGLVFNVSSDQGAVFFDPYYDGSAGPDSWQLRYHANGTLIESGSYSSGGTVGAEHGLKSGVEYRLTVDGNAPYDAPDYGSTPQSGGVLSVSDGYIEGSGTTDKVKGIGFVGVGAAADVSYTGGEHTADAETLFADIQTTTTTTVRAQANTGSGWADVNSTTISSDQNVSLDISSSSADRYRTVVESSTAGGEQTVAVEDEGLMFTASAPTLSNADPADGSNVDDYDGDLSVDVADADFDLAQGDVVTIVASNDDGTIGQKQANSNGTISIDYQAKIGQNNITWTATDEYGESDTLTANFSTPDGITFVNETNTSQTVTSPIEIEVQFINETAITSKTTTTGTVSFAGLPANGSFIVEVQPSDDYHGRTIYLDSLLEQRTVYLLSTNVSSVETRFVLEDQTGQFSNRAIVSIEKAINESGTVQFKTIHSDRFGTEGVTVDLEEGQRYRTSVRSVSGLTQDTGPYRADVSETVTVNPGSPSVALENYEEGWAADATLNNQTLEFRFDDPDGETDRLDIFVYEKGNTSNQLGTNRTFFNLGEAQGTYSLSADQSNKTWVVRFDVDRDGEEFTAERTVSNQPNLVPELSEEWRLIFGIGLLLISSGIFSILNAGVGGVVVALEGGILWWTGWLGGATTGVGVVLALFVAVAVHLYGSRL